MIYIATNKEDKDALMHWGVKGMKWRRRRKKNKEDRYKEYQTVRRSNPYEDLQNSTHRKIKNRRPDPEAVKTRIHDQWFNTIGRYNKNKKPGSAKSNGALIGFEWLRNNSVSRKEPNKDSQNRSYGNQLKSGSRSRRLKSGKR